MATSENLLAHWPQAAEIVTRSPELLVKYLWAVVPFHLLKVLQDPHRVCRAAGLGQSDTFLCFRRAAGSFAFWFATFRAGRTNGGLRGAQRPPPWSPSDVTNAKGSCRVA